MFKELFEVGSILAALPQARQMLAPELVARQHIKRRIDRLVTDALAGILGVHAAQSASDLGGRPARSQLGSDRREQPAPHVKLAPVAAAHAHRSRVSCGIFRPGKVMRRWRGRVSEGPGFRRRRVLFRLSAEPLSGSRKTISAPSRAARLRAPYAPRSTRGGTGSRWNSAPLGQIAARSKCGDGALGQRGETGMKLGFELAPCGLVTPFEVPSVVLIAHPIPELARP
jgi:hypothetical protein